MFIVCSMCGDKLRFDSDGHLCCRYHGRLRPRDPIACVADDISAAEAKTLKREFGAKFVMNTQKWEEFVTLSCYKASSHKLNAFISRIKKTFDLWDEERCLEAYKWASEIERKE